MSIGFRRTSFGGDPEFNRFVDNKIEFSKSNNHLNKSPISPILPFSLKTIWPSLSFSKLVLILLLFCTFTSTHIAIAQPNSDQPIQNGRTRISKNPKPERHMRRLYDDLFNDYEKELRPVLNDSEPLTVTIQFWLKQILKVDERDQTIKCYLWLELYWTDELLKWNPSEYGGLDQIHVPSHKIWRPDVLVYNNAQLNVDENELETNSMVTHRGEVTLFRAMINDITCTLSLSLFPFDQQVCFLTFASWSMDGSKLLLLAANTSDNLALYIRNTEWTLTDFSVKLYEKRYDCCLYPFPDLTFFFVLKRSPSYYIFTLIIPSTCITVVTIVGFFTPHSTTGENTEKVSLGVNALLSMSIIMMMVSGEVPATSEVIPLIGKYYIGLIFLIFGAAFTVESYVNRVFGSIVIRKYCLYSNFKTTVTLAFQMRGNSGTPMSPRMKYILFEKIARSPLGSWFFAVQIGRKHKLANRAKGGPKNKENNTYIFDNICVNQPGTTPYDGCISNSINSNSLPTTNGVKMRNNANSTTVNDAKLAKIVQMQELTGDLHKLSDVGLDSNHLMVNSISSPTQNPLTERVYKCIEGIEESITKTHQQRNIEFEWEMAARIIERIIMIIFITLTVLFAFFMLGGAGEEIRLTDELMDKVKK